MTPPVQDGEIWTFTVRAFDSPIPRHTINVNYDGFAEGVLYKLKEKVKLFFSNEL